MGAVRSSLDRQFRLTTGAGRRVTRRDPGIPHGAHRFEIRHVSQPDSGLQHLLSGRAGFFEQDIDARKRITRLCLDSGGAGVDVQGADAGQ